MCIYILTWESKGQFLINTNKKCSFCTYEKENDDTARKWDKNNDKIMKI
jgi:hypothetical protein